MAVERLQKVLARAGVASRRRSEQIIAQGRVTVDGRVVTEMGVKVDLDSQDVRCDGERLRPEPCVYYLLHKPAGVVCTTSDAENRPRAVDLIPRVSSRVYTVGRLDADTEGLVIITNDGELTERVSHPRYGVPKTYRAWVRGALSSAALRRLLSGIVLDGRRCRAVAARALDREPARTLVELTLLEGRNREVRRLLYALGHPVERLVRVAIGPLSSERLAAGQWRRLKPDEVQALRDSAPHPGAARSAGRPRRPPSPSRGNSE